jgi:2-alkenal reductase
MNRIGNAIKISLASTVIALLLAMGVMPGLSNSGSTTPAASYTTSQVAAVADTSTIQAQTAAELQEQPLTIVDARTAVRAAGPAVVTVVNTMQVTSRGRFGSGTRTAEALGSGVIISDQGYIVTNQHVVDGQTSLEVIFSDGTRVAATLVGEDASSDLAVIKVDVAVPAVATLGDSDTLVAGQPVVAIGTALGDFQNTVTEGIISGLHRQLDDSSVAVQDMIQTDAAINHGNSGGPLLELEGKVVGINTAVVRTDSAAGDVAEGLGFAIPVNTVKKVVEQLIASGSPIQ